MAQHVEIFNQFQTKRKTEGLDLINSKPDRLLVLKMVIKCADISNPARPLDLYKKWVDCIMEEFWSQVFDILRKVEEYELTLCRETRSVRETCQSLLSWTDLHQT